MQTTVKERIKIFIKSKNIGQSAFEKVVGLSNGYVNNIRQSIQPDKLQKIALCYSDLNTGWLMTGEGNMLRGEMPPAQQPEPTKLPTVEGTNLIDEIKQQAEQIGVLKNENKHQNELVKKLNAEIEQLKNKIRRLQSGTGEHGHTIDKVQELPHVPERLTEDQVLYLS
jgi:transcriptional regulator with XRE-family HTH domain